MEEYLPDLSYSSSRALISLQNNPTELHLSDISDEELQELAKEEYVSEKNGEYPYDVLRNIAIKNGNYPTQIAKEIGRGGREEANRLCSKLHERKMLSKQKDGNSTVYTIKGEGWTSLVEEIWNQDQTPEELEKHWKNTS